MFSMPETSVHVWDKNREISPLERERKVTGEGSGEEVSFKTRMEDPVRHADHRFMSRVRAWQWRRALWGGKALWGSYSRSWMWTDPDRRRRPRCAWWNLVGQHSGWSRAGNGYIFLIVKFLKINDLLVVSLVKKNILKLLQALHEVLDPWYSNALWQCMQHTFSMANVLLSAFNLNLKCSFNRLVMLLYFTPESLSFAMFCLLFRHVPS